MNEAFKELVSRDVKGETTHDENLILANDVRAWLAELNKLKRDVEIQLANHRAKMPAKQAEFIEKNDRIAWLKYKSEAEQWRLGAVRFMVSVEERMHYAKRIRAGGMAYEA